jgi:uncharacterized protein (DUF433 family)
MAQGDPRFEEAAEILVSLESFLRGFLVVTLRRCLPTSLVFLFPGFRSQAMQFPELERITLSLMIMSGKPCIRGMRITVGTIVGVVASGASFEEILQLYPYLESEDIRAAVAYAAWLRGARNALEDSAGHESLSRLDSFSRIWRTLRCALEFHRFPFGFRY